MLVGGGANKAPEVYKRLPDVLDAHAGSIRVKPRCARSAWRWRDATSTTRTRIEGPTVGPSFGKTAAARGRWRHRLPSAMTSPSQILALKVTRGLVHHLTPVLMNVCVTVAEPVKLPRVRRARKLARCRKRTPVTPSRPTSGISACPANERRSRMTGWLVRGGLSRNAATSRRGPPTSSAEWQRGHTSPTAHNNIAGTTVLHTEHRTCARSTISPSPTPDERTAQPRHAAQNTPD